MDLSVVVPCYNEEESLRAMHTRLKAACDAAPVTSYEIIFVNDGSKDGTFPIMQELVQADDRLVIVDLSRNHGQPLALSAGLAQAKGEYVLIIDADLQDPPELLTPMLERARTGIDVVYGQRQNRKGETWLKLITARLFYKTLSFLSDVKIPENVGDFRLISRRVLDHLLAMPEQHRYFRGLVSWIGFKQEAFPYERDPRYAGVTKYPFFKLIQYAADAITSFSIRPLRVSLLFAMLGVFLATCLALYAFYGYFFGRAVVAGWASLATIITFFASLQLICLGLIGEYVGRAYMQVKDRPLFIIRGIYRK